MKVTIDIMDTPAAAASVEIRTPSPEAVTPTGPAGVAGGALPEARQFDGGADMGTPAPAESAIPTISAAETGAARDGGAAPDIGEMATDRPIPVQIEALDGRSGGASAI